MFPKKGIHSHRRSHTHAILVEYHYVYVEGTIQIARKRRGRVVVKWLVMQAIRKQRAGSILSTNTPLQSCGNTFTRLSSRLQDDLIRLISIQRHSSRGRNSHAAIKTHEIFKDLCGG